MLLHYRNLEMPLIRSFYWDRLWLLAFSLPLPSVLQIQQRIGVLSRNQESLAIALANLQKEVRDPYAAFSHLMFVLLTSTLILNL